MQEASRKILNVLKRIPRGRVASYGAVAARAGVPNGARTVARLLHACTDAEGLPWHRVLRSDGRIALPEGGGLELQRALLLSEGVEVGPGGRVDLGRWGWDS